MLVWERLRSCWCPSRLAHHGDLRSSWWSKPLKLHWPPFESTTRRLLWYLSNASSGRPRQSQQASFTPLSSRAIFIFLWIRPSFIHETHTLSSLFSTRPVKKLACFYESQFRGFIEHFSFRFCQRLKEHSAKVLISTCWTISVCKLLQIVNFDGLTFLVVFNQSDNLKFSNTDCHWLIVAWFMWV